MMWLFSCDPHHHRHQTGHQEVFCLGGVFVRANEMLDGRRIKSLSPSRLSCSSRAFGHNHHTIVDIITIVDTVLTMIIIIIAAAAAEHFDGSLWKCPTGRGGVIFNPILSKMCLVAVQKGVRCIEHYFEEFSNFKIFVVCWLRSNDSTLKSLWRCRDVLTISYQLFPLAFKLL